jgi:ferredoxin-fold anticodon binding domain-containing protein
MKANDISFNERFYMSIFSEYLNKNIHLNISDELDASEEELTDKYREKIASFVNNTPQWYGITCDSIIAWTKNVYKIDVHLQDIELMGIYILFEQNEHELFGLIFRVEFDIEHGCGIKIKINEGKYEIIEIGTGEVAFC